MSGIPHIADSGWPFIKTMVARDVVDSTSTLAAELVRENQCALPLVVWARTQTRGRGRGGHQWWSDPDSLTMTLAVDPREHRLSLEAEPGLALATAVAIIDALNDLGLGSPRSAFDGPTTSRPTDKSSAGFCPNAWKRRKGTYCWWVSV